MSMTQNQIYPKKYDAVYREEKERQAQHLRLVREVQATDEQSARIQDFIDRTNIMSVATLLIAIAFIILFFLFGTGTASAQELDNAESGYSMNEGLVAFTEGFNCMHHGDFDRAIKRLTDSIVYNPDYASAYAFRAVAYYETGEYELALLDFNRAIEISPSYESAYRWRGNTHEVLGHWMLAKQDWQIADQLAIQSV